MKVAYWPGCVSRGFTPELHGSMAKVAPKLDIEMIELERANCCGAGGQLLQRSGLDLRLDQRALAVGARQQLRLVQRAVLLDQVDERVLVAVAVVAVLDVEIAGRATASTSSGCATSPRTRTGSTTARTASTASKPARRALRR